MFDNNYVTKFTAFKVLYKNLRFNWTERKQPNMKAIFQIMLSLAMP